MNSYAAIFVLLNFAAGYGCLKLGRRSWLAAIIFLPASILWFIAILIQHHSLIESSIWTTDPAIVWVIASSLVPLLGSAAAVWIQLRRRRFIDDVRAGRCLHCGYDLRFVKRSLCPECGNRV
jgi:hypothetical protein